jgi:small subunit ribosomal protein S2
VCQRTGQFYVTHRWMGGMLTNFAVIQKRLRRLADLRVLRDRGDFERMSTKEANVLRDDLDRLESNFAGMAEMKRLPGALFVIDCKKERISITEANKLGIPIVAIVDSNCDPEPIQLVIPGNDDAIRSCRLIVSTVGDAIAEGQRLLGERELRERQEMEAAARAEADGRAAQARGSAGEAAPEAADAQSATTPANEKQEVTAP